MLFLFLHYLDPQLWPEGSYELGSVLSSFLPSVRKFSWDWLISFFGNSAWCWRPMCCVWQPDFKKNCSKNGGNGPKIGFIGKCSHFFWIWLIKKADICCILARIPYFGKIWFLRYGPKCSRLILLKDF